MMIQFRWNEWNVDHIAEHDVGPREAEFVVRHAVRPYPRRARNDTWLVRGRTAAGRFLQVVFSVDPDQTVYVIHARDLNEAERRRL